MGWEDRPYYRDPRPGSGGGIINWILTGSVHLFTFSRIRVRIHAALIILIVLVLLFGFGTGNTVADRVQFILALFGVILLHEFGHCFAARWTGGDANEILMTPLGGLAMTMARRKPWPTFVTVAGGPLVNVIICIVCGVALYFLIGIAPLTPGQFVGTFDRSISRDSSLLDIAGYLFYIHAVSYALLLFNLLPVFPLDGGQLLQSILWKPMGYFKSMMVALNIGIGGGVLMMMIGIATMGIAGGGLMLTFIGLMCLMNSYQMRTMMKTEGPWAFSDEDMPDYGGGYGGGYAGTATINQPRKKPAGPGWFARRKIAKAVESEAEEQAQVDAILAKVSKTGMNSLTNAERKYLKKASENQRKRDELKSAARKRGLGG